MNWILEAFEPEFMQRALLAGIAAAVATSCIGTWVVLRGLAFLGDALAHGVIPGVAIALTMGFSPIIGAFIAAIVMSLAVSAVSSRTLIREDTGIGLLFVGMLSVGVIIISRSASFSADVTSLLFGDVLGVTKSDVYQQMIAAVIVIAVSTALYRPFLALTFNRAKAHTLGMAPGVTQAALLILLTISIVASFQAIGTLLVFGLLIAPPATASLIVKRVPFIIATASALGIVSVISGLVVSFHFGTAGGATISAIAVGFFFVALTIRELSSARTRHQDPETDTSLMSIEAP